MKKFLAFTSLLALWSGTAYSDGNVLFKNTSKHSVKIELLNQGLGQLEEPFTVQKGGTLSKDLEVIIKKVANDAKDDASSALVFKVWYTNFGKKWPSSCQIPIDKKYATRDYDKTMSVTVSPSPANPSRPTCNARIHNYSNRLEIRKNTSA